MHLILASIASLALSTPIDERSAIADSRSTTTTDKSMPTRRCVLRGVVLEPDGQPAANVAVESSAGGRALTDSEGRYELTIEAPRDADRVQVTAGGRGDGGWTARDTAMLASASSATLVAPLVLEPSLACEREWVPTFGQIHGTLNALVVFDDGTGPALYGAGYFSTSLNQFLHTVAKWNGSSWILIMPGMNGTIRALAVFDDGNGPALYAASGFSSAGGVLANSIAKWNGSSWSPLGSGLQPTFATSVSALAVFDDGSGPALYAAGTFTSAGGSIANRIAKWDGVSWSTVGTSVAGGGLDGAVNALVVFDDGNGPALYAGGEFLNADGTPANRMAKWDGASWSALGSGMIGPTALVLALTVFDDGNGGALYAGGGFATAGGVAVAQVARWDGASWSALGTGTDSYVRALTAFDDGNGDALYAGGVFSIAGGTPVSQIAKWDGASWSAVGSGLGGGVVHALTVFDDGGGAELCAAGSFTMAGGNMVNPFAQWNGSNWTAPRPGLNDDVLALVEFDDGGGTALYAAGAFISGGGVATNRIAKWDGTSWAALGTGMNNYVSALEVFDGGGGPALFAGGFFTNAGTSGARRIAKWNGTTWSSIGSALNDSHDEIKALKVFDDGSGPALYVGGFFTSVGGVGAKRIARWDGSSWSALGGGMDNAVFALAVFDDGNGPALYAAGAFETAGPLPANRIAKWADSRWLPLGDGIYGLGEEVYALAVFDDGRGPALYAGGNFVNAGTPGKFRIARWDGTSWSALGSGMNNDVLTLSVFDDGGGRALYAGGHFTTASGVAARRIAKWDGTQWSALDGGMNGAVAAIASFNDGQESALCIGGMFPLAYDSGDAYLAKWSCGRDDVPPELSCPASVAAIDAIGSPPGEIVTFSVTADDDQDRSPSVDCSPPSGSFFPRGATLVHCTATDVSGNQSTCQFTVMVTPRVVAAATAK